jgi:hypothetical protein
MRSLPKTLWYKTLKCVVFSNSHFVCKLKRLGLTCSERIGRHDKSGRRGAAAPSLPRFGFQQTTHSLLEEDSPRRIHEFCKTLGGHPRNLPPARTANESSNLPLRARSSRPVHGALAFHQINRQLDSKKLETANKEQCDLLLRWQRLLHLRVHFPGGP